MHIEIRRLSGDETKALGIPPKPSNVAGWSVWECEPSKFNWHYDSQEQAYVYHGRVRVTAGNETFEIGPGDYVVFPAELSCSWEVKEKIVKVYKFS